MKKRALLLLLSTLLVGSYELMAQWQPAGNLLTGGERLGSNNNFPVVFYTNAADRGRITEAGLWGINTGAAVPGARFHINSSLGQHSLRVDVNNVARLMVNSNGGTSLGTSLTPPANGLYVNGKSGFGTNMPTAKVQITYNSTVSDPQLLLYESDNDFARVNFKNSISSNYFSVVGKPAVNNQDARLNFYYNVTGIGNIMTLQGDGNVGIGLDGATAKLQIRGNPGQDALRVTVDGSTKLKVYGNGGVAIGENPSDIPVDGLYVNGNTGIGVANPEEKLRVNSAAGQTALRVQVANATKLMVYDNGGVAIGENPASIPANGLYVNGNVGIGTSNPAYKLSVDGTIQAKEIRVETGWADYVFDNQYHLVPLPELENFIKANKHLPGIAPAKDIQQNGLAVAAMQTKLMEKIEELTLYIISQNKEIQHLTERIDQLENTK